MWQDVIVMPSLRFNDFKIEEIESLNNILDKAYLEKPTWLGGDNEFVCLFIDLDKSSKQSFKKQPKTMAKIYDYFTQNIVDIFNHPKIAADYIDIKGDGAFGIFEGEKASFKALYCAITFKTIFEQTIRNKFSTDTDKLSCKFGIHKDKILVRRIGKRGEGNYNEVWAGRLVNNASKLASQSKNIPLEENSNLPILVSEQVYSDFEKNKEYGFYYCCNNGVPMTEQIEMFEVFQEFSDETLGDKLYYTRVLWCENCADSYINLI
ncbi:adenylate/guanylate cyclase domain-containing protein [Patescibacteria group bacterium]